MLQPAPPDRPARQQHSYSVSHNPEAQASQFAGWTLQYRQLSGGRFCGRSSISRWSGISIHAEELNRRILQRGRVPADSIAVGIPLTLQGHARMCGKASSRDTLHVFSCHPDFEFTSPEYHLLVNLEISMPALAPENLTLARQLQTLLDSPALPLQADAAQQLRQLLCAAMQAGLPTAELPAAIRHLQQKQREQQLLYGLIETVSLQANPARDLPRRERSWKILRQVEQLLADPASCVLSVAELCVRLHLSRRTLQYVFEYAAGMSPVSYLRAIRLNHARQALLKGESVTYAATQWGFLHLSAFAHDYQQLFGELPSTTQKRLRLSRQLLHTASD
jgi:AraC family ethanolamine operon transcriptional activator